MYWVVTGHLTDRCWRGEVLVIYRKGIKSSFTVIGQIIGIGNSSLNGGKKAILLSYGSRFPKSNNKK